MLMMLGVQYATTTCTPSARKGRCPTVATPPATPRGGPWTIYAPPTTGARATCPPVPSVSSAASRAGAASAWPPGNANGAVWPYVPPFFLSIIIIIHYQLYQSLYYS